MALLVIKLPDGAEMKYDPAARMAYIKLREGVVHETREEAPNIMVDINSKGHLIGVEIISPRSFKDETRITTALRKLSKEFDEPQLRSINPRMLGVYQPA
jgi:uncharacterized protein YuzE